MKWPRFRSEETESDHFIIAQKENHAGGHMLPPALILWRDGNDLLTFRDEPQQVIPGKVLRNGIANQISDLSLARLAIALRHLLATAPLVIARIEASPRVGLIEILRIGAADREIDFVDVPVVRIVECEDHVVTDLAPLLWMFLLHPQSPLTGLIEDLRTTIGDLKIGRASCRER